MDTGGPVHDGESADERKNYKIGLIPERSQS